MESERWAREQLDQEVKARTPDLQADGGTADSLECLGGPGRGIRHSRIHPFTTSIAASGAFAPARFILCGSCYSCSKLEPRTLGAQ